jgi:hypothetical protein
MDKNCVKGLLQLYRESLKPFKTIFWGANVRRRKCRRRNCREEQVSQAQVSRRKGRGTEVFLQQYKGSLKTYIHLSACEASSKWLCLSLQIKVHLN